VDIYEEIVALRQQAAGCDRHDCQRARSIPSFETAKMLVRDDGSMSNHRGGCVEAEVWQAAREVMENEPLDANIQLIRIRNTIPARLWGTLDIFVEPVLPPATLYLFGQVMYPTSLQIAKLSVSMSMD